MKIPDDKEVDEVVTEYEVGRSLKRRVQGSMKYLVQLVDETSAGKSVEALESCADLMVLYDWYAERHFDRTVSHAKFITKDMFPMKLMDNIPRNDCRRRATIGVRADRGAG